MAFAGTLTTENLGIERLVANTISDPYLRFVLVCGPEVEQRIGHHPGGSLLALAANGTDQKARIIAAPGRRPRLRNLTRPPPAPVPPVTPARRQRCRAAWPCLQRAAPAGRTIADPAGYLVIHADSAGGCW